MFNLYDKLVMESKNIVLLDQCGDLIGTASKLESHFSNTPLHKGFSLFLFDSLTQKLLLQKRSPEKKVWPGVWSNSVCGHQQLGESNKEAVLRCAKFELGLQNILDLTYIFSHKYSCVKDDIMEHEICDVFVAQFHLGELCINKDEVEETMLIDWPEFVNSYDELKVPYWCVKASQYLLEDDIFKSFYNKTSLEHKPDK